MLYELQGTIYTLGEVTGGQTRTGGTWQKREVVVEVKEDRFTNLVALTAFGDKVEDLEKFQEGDEVSVKFSISAREYNGRYYTDVNIVSIRRSHQEGWSERLSKNGPQPPRRQEAQAPAPVRPTTQEILDGTSAPGTDDDLPF